MILFGLPDSLLLSDVYEQLPGEGRPNRHPSLRVYGHSIRSVHLPGDVDAPELMLSRLRAIDRGRNTFRKRIKKKPQPRPERLPPLVSGKVTEADSFGV